MPVISGGGGAAFNGGTITGKLVIADTAQENPLHVTGGDAVNGGIDVLANVFGSFEVKGIGGNSGSIELSSDSGGTNTILKAGTGQHIGVYTQGALVTALHAAPDDGDLSSGDCAVWFDQTNGSPALNLKGKQADGTVVSGIVPRLAQLSPKGTVVSGALSTVQLVTATGAQILTTRDAETVTPCTFNPGAATTATVTVALSPDNVTYSTLGVETEPAGVAFDGTIHLVKVRVPAGWYLKLTVNAQAVLGLTTWY